jgi:hypothetical protein
MSSKSDLARLESEIRPAAGGRRDPGLDRDVEREGRSS